MKRLTMRAMMEWACSVSVVVGVMLVDHTQPGPTGGRADGERPRSEGACARVPEQREGRTG